MMRERLTKSGGGDVDRHARVESQNLSGEVHLGHVSKNARSKPHSVRIKRDATLQDCDTYLWKAL